MIKFYPMFGLCNRMRAMSSAIELATAIQQELELYWVRNEHLNSPFWALFEPIKGVKLVECSRVPIFFRPGRKRNLFIPDLVRTIGGGPFFHTSRVYQLSSENYDFLQLKQYKTSYISSCVSFFQAQTTYNSFKPTALIREQIANESKSFNTYTVGVHIRRTDNEKARTQSSLALFIDVMQQEIQREPLTNFYVASDDTAVKVHLMNRFGERIKTNCEPVNRTTVQGMQRAVVELYTLSKTQKVFGSYWSSFSRTACAISGIPEITVRS